jgi:hypothetical protein
MVAGVTDPDSKDRLWLGIVSVLSLAATIAADVSRLSGTQRGQGLQASPVNKMTETSETASTVDRAAGERLRIERYNPAETTAKIVT